MPEVPGMVFYIFYSQHHSVCGQEADEERAALTGPPLIDQDRAVTGASRNFIPSLLGQS